MGKVGEEWLEKQYKEADKYDKRQKKLNKANDEERIATDEEIEEFLSKMKVTDIQEKQVDKYDKLYYQGRGIQKQFKKAKSKNDYVYYSDLVEAAYDELKNKRISENDSDEELAENHLYDIDDSLLDYNVEDLEIDNFIKKIDDYLENEGKKIHIIQKINFNLLKGKIVKLKKKKIRLQHFLNLYDNIADKTQFEYEMIGKINDNLLSCEAYLDACILYNEYLKGEEKDFNFLQKPDKIVSKFDLSYDEAHINSIFSMMSSKEESFFRELNTSLINIDDNSKSELIDIQNEFLSLITKKAEIINRIDDFETRKISFHNESREIYDDITEEEKDKDEIEQKIDKLYKRFEKIKNRENNGTSR